MLLQLFFLLLASFCLAQMEPMNMCSSATTAPPCTLTFTPFMTPQIAPTSTVWGDEETIVYNVVDCRYCTVTNVPNNPVASGPFTTRVTVPILTVTVVGCMEETTAITRRDFRGYDSEPTPNPAAKPAVGEHLYSPLGADTTPTDLHHVAKLALGKDLNSPPVKRQSESSPNNHTVVGLSGEAADLIKELVTAEYSLALLGTPGIDLHSLCLNLRESTILPEGGGLNLVSIDPNQAADIICFASIYGVDLNSTTPMLLSNLSAAIIAIDLEALFNLTAEASDFCSIIDYSPLPELGVDADAVSSYICSDRFPTPTPMPNPPPPPTSPASAAASSTVFSSEPFASSGASGTEASGTGSGPTSTGTSGPEGSGSAPTTGPWSNSTMTGTGTGPMSTLTGTHLSSHSGRGNHTSYHRTGTGTGTAAGSDVVSIEFPQATTVERRSPPKPRKANVGAVYYPAFETSTTSKGGYFRGY